MNNLLIKEIKDPSKRPQLIGYPHGVQGSDITEPEAISFEILSQFVCRWKGSIVYHFPCGYDARYWRALAEANSLIARYEQYVLKGSPKKKHSLQRVSPLPITQFEDAGGDVKEFNILQSFEFEKDGKRVFAIANAWEKGGCFFRLKPQELKQGKRYVLWQPHKERCFGNDKASVALSAEDLSKGMLLHVGALRFSFFMLEPYQEGKSYGEAVMPGTMEKALGKRLPVIRKAFEYEEATTKGVTQKQ